jgi:hypothetical protein
MWTGYMTERIVISVSQNAVVQAESAILGCNECSAGATMPFWQVVDQLRNHCGPSVVYLLPVLATCPNCHSGIHELTLITPSATITERPTHILVHSNT